MATIFLLFLFALLHMDTLSRQDSVPEFNKGARATTFRDIRGKAHACRYLICKVSEGQRGVLCRTETHVDVGM